MQYFGQFDGIRNGEIYGWAFDAAAPNVPVKLTIHVNCRAVGAVMSVYYRPDVAGSMGCSGSNGFYFDMSQYFSGSEEFILDLRFPNGQLLKGTPVCVRVPPQIPVHAPRILFIHIPKTAGTAFREAVEANYPQSHLGYIYPHPPGFPVRLEQLPVEQRSSFRFVSGHAMYGFHEHLPNRNAYFTILREPLSRAWSHYSYWIEKREPVAIAPDGRVRTVPELFDQEITVDLDNFMVRCISGLTPALGKVDREVYDVALAHLENDFFYVGVQDWLGEALSFLQEKLGWRNRAAVASVNAGSYSSVGQRTSKEEQILRYFNEWDLKLYEEILRRRRERMAV